eukprot:2008138-Pleurochrysis_carterae.AAC.2
MLWRTVKSSSFERCAPANDHEMACSAKPRPSTRISVCSRRQVCCAPAEASFASFAHAALSVGAAPCGAVYLSYATIA